MLYSPHSIPHVLLALSTPRVLPRKDEDNKWLPPRRSMFVLPSVAPPAVQEDVRRPVAYAKSGPIPALDRVDPRCFLSYVSLLLFQFFKKVIIIFDKAPVLLPFSLSLFLG